MSLIFYKDNELPTFSDLKRNYFREQFRILRNIPQPIQKSPEWYKMRESMLTASDWGSVLGLSPYSNKEKVLISKCTNTPFYSNSAMAWGNKYEDVAIKIYEYRNNTKIIDFGCIRHPYIPFLGASPDGITEDGIMLEIKCPTSREITGIPPPYYWSQVQGQLEVCDLDRCDFLECDFKEYNNENEYINDNYNNNYYLNNYGNEKGVIAEFYNNSTKTFFYDYSSVCLIGDDLEKWKLEINNRYNNSSIIFSCFSYWYLKDVSCVPIYRNQEWFYNAKFELESFWNDVIKYRQLGGEILLNDIKKQKEEKKIIRDENKKENKKESKKIIKKKNNIVDSNKKQKKIKEYIVLDDNMEVINEKSSSSSDEDYSYDDDNIFSNKSMFTDDVIVQNKSNLSWFSD